jgi:hypothetical protein
LGLFSRLSFPNKEEGFSYVVPLRPHSGEHSGNVDFDFLRAMSEELYNQQLQHGSNNSSLKSEPSPATITSTAWLV